MKKICSIIALSFTALHIQAQPKQAIINAIEKEAKEHSQLERLGTELFDGIGPRLVGSPNMDKAGNWALAQFKKWGISAHKEDFGKWRGWKRGETRIKMTTPREVSLSGTQLAWSGSTNGKFISGKVIPIPLFKDSLELINWLPQVKGKIVLTSLYQITGRPMASWKKHAVKKDYEHILKLQKEQKEAWAANFKNLKIKTQDLHRALEDAGAIGLLTSNPTGGWGAQRIMKAYAKTIPTVNLSLEDYGMLYRLHRHNQDPTIEIATNSDELGDRTTFNTIATIKGTEKPDEVILLSAHFDSWDGATGATDNGTGVILQMEVMRILKEVYPNPKRTIMLGLWNAEEHGLHGSKAFVKDNADLIPKISVVFNQDNGTGRVNFINGQGFLNCYDYFNRWFQWVPEDARASIRTKFPSYPDRGSSDHATFVRLDVPAFFLISTDYDYGRYTWHSQYDTYDKVNFEDVRRNAVLFASLAYLASEEEGMVDRTRALFPLIDKEKPERRKYHPYGDAERCGGHH